MHQALRASFAIELQALAKILTENWAWRSPQAAFAEWCFAKRSQTTFFARPEPPGTDRARMDEAPVLAAVGYRLAAHPASAAALIEPWCAGTVRLSERDSFPLDRMSFFFRPIELLGVAVGAAAVRDQCPQPQQWLTRLLRDGAGKLNTPPLAAILACQAAAELGHTPAVIGHLNPGTLSPTELAAMWMLLVSHPSVAAVVGVGIQPRDVHSLILERVAVNGVVRPDVAEAALLHLSLTDALHSQLAARAIDTHDQALNLVIGLCRRFPAVARRLTHRRADRTAFLISDEYDVQDLLHAMLAAHFDDIRPEEPTGSRAGAASRMDFLLKKQRIVVETKMTRRGLDQRKIGEELIIDRERYRAHPDCQTLVCFVYDPDHRCANPRGLEADLTDLGAPLPTVVIIVPQD